MASQAGWVPNTGLKQVFDDLPERLKGDVPTLQEIIATRVGIRLNRHTLPVPDSYLPYFGNLQAKQYPNELAQFLAFLYSVRSEVCTYLEIGVERCGTFFTVDSYLRSVNPEFRWSMAVDKVEKGCSFDAYQRKYDCCFCRMRSADLVLTGPVDLVLVDGDHSYEGVRGDVERVKNEARYVALHDIACEGIRGIEVGRLWDELKDTWPSREFVNRDPAIPGALGIGVLKCG